MEQISYAIPIRKFGTTLAIILDKRFCEELKIKDHDFVIPCSVPLSKQEKKAGEHDIVLGERKIVFKFVRSTKQGIESMLVYIHDDE